MKIFETHAHYDDEAFREDREALFDEMFANDIDTIINVGAIFAGCEQSVALASTFSFSDAVFFNHAMRASVNSSTSSGWIPTAA